jgi:hypothetical protein
VPDHGSKDLNLMVAQSQNSYSANDQSVIKTYLIPGTTRKVRLRIGPPGELLVHLAAWFDKNVEDIDAGQLDEWGYAERPIRGSTTTLSNHASGTAIDLNATKHPLGERGTFTPEQVSKIRAALHNTYQGAIRWGGDYVNRADEMHFEIVAAPPVCASVLASLTTATPPPTEENPLSALTDADAAKIGAAVAAAVVQPLADKLDKIDQKYTVADNNYDSQRAAYEAVAQAEAAHILAGGTPHTADQLNGTQAAVWSYLRPLWSAQ